MTTDREFLCDMHVAIEEQLTMPPGVGDLVLELPQELPTEAPMGQWSGWVSPAPVYQGHEPVLTGNEFDEDHPGRDIAYLNWTGLPSHAPEIYGGPDPPDNRYYVPTGTIPLVAPGPGHIWYSKKTSMGWTVRLDHHDWTGLLLNSYVTHMSKLFVPEWDGGGGGPYVYAGQPLGLIGAGPTSANHIHMELWVFGEGKKWDRPGIPIDPKLYLPHWGRLLLAA
jgi:hypothetical protein